MLSSQPVTSKHLGASRLSAVGFWPTMLAAPLALYSIAYPALRQIDALGVIAVFTLGAISVAMTKRVDLARSYIWFFAFSVGVLAISLAGEMPTAWTRYHDNFAALRQWSWVIIFPVAVSAFSELLRSWSGLLRRNGLTVLIACIIVSRASRLLFADVTVTNGIFLYTLSNDVAIIYCLFAVWLFLDRRAPSWVKVLSLALALAVSSSAQSQIVVALLCVIYLVRMPRLTFWVYVSALSAFLAVAPYFALELHRMDPNTGIRSSLWRDTITAVEQTFGVGVGYGTEYITNNFIELKGRSWTVISESAAGRLFIGTHSGIYDVLLRLGVVGLLLFAIWLLQELAVAGRSRNLATAQTTAGIGIVLMTAIFVNVGMASMGFVFGVSFCVAALRHFARDGEYLGPRR